MRNVVATLDLKAPNSAQYEIETACMRAGLSYEKHRGWFGKTKFTIKGEVEDMLRAAPVLNVYYRQQEGRDLDETFAYAEQIARRKGFI